MHKYLLNNLRKNTSNSDKNDGVTQLDFQEIIATIPGTAISNRISEDNAFTTSCD